MSIKIQKQYIDKGFGFPVHLLNVPMIKIRGNWTPKINYNDLSDLVLRVLAVKPSKLTGNEIKFIRNKLELSLVDFAEKFYVTHPAVIKWEQKENEPTGMNWATEKDIRLFISFHLDEIAKTQTSNKPDFMEVYQQLSHQASDKKSNTKIDLQEVLI